MALGLAFNDRNRLQLSIHPSFAAVHFAPEGSRQRPNPQDIDLVIFKVFLHLLHIRRNPFLKNPFCVLGGVKGVRGKPNPIDLSCRPGRRGKRRR